MATTHRLPTESPIEIYLLTSIYMTKFGIICPPYPGHLNPQTVLARELQSRGHRVTFLQIPDLAEKIRSSGVDFHPIGETIYRAGTMAETFANLGKLSSIEALRYSLDFCVQMVEIICQDAPKAIEHLGIDALIVDQLEPVGETVAEAIDLPYITVSCGQAIHRRADVPPFYTPWMYRDTFPARIRNQSGYYFLDRGCQLLLQAINSYRHRWNLADYPRIYASNARNRITQQPPAFEFPIANPPENLHYVGPLRSSSPNPAFFPYEKLTGQPMIYASLGSVQNTKFPLFQRIAAACKDLDAQLVIAHGGGMSADEARSLPGTPLVVEYAPQPDILARASLTITHGGMNTILDSLTYGVPLVAIPITFEQPGNGARVRYLEVGEVFSLNNRSISKLRSTVQRVFTEEKYRENARKIQQSIARSGGVKQAADIIEKATTGRKSERSSTIEIPRSIAP
ncbi:glycosyltransferase [Pannus brasiliensis CCIBt3594]|uniref:Glycosyltransferase n=1 Tax=Pannus brasiliensis CCIBt3594 TaxID=1427578 RepID=A0AAW9QYD2_9CHRO